MMKDHDKKYVFSTGGDFDDKNLYPGIAIYHQGMDLVAVVSTGKLKKIPPKKRKFRHLKKCDDCLKVSIIRHGF